ncbi:hypothetical protein CBR_g41098 [Chara braunii]|uniref:Uncharacterized protein n=1 Tax=Chara braunii TaxID=69332 RepID=A0A388LV34_CHABU|nr:hypothetical protein CBR_g41098 [Chara braunii]|eukprot:GBG86194.1 hypothetical protein CBR_g41098 [Chara braunii]
MTDHRDHRSDRDFGFVAADTHFGYRHYEVDANGILVLRLEMGLEYVGNDLCDVAIFVTKLHEDVPYQHVGEGDDVVKKIDRLLLSSVALEHDGRLAGIAEWEGILDTPLIGRCYLHGELRFDM